MYHVHIARQQLQWSESCRILVAVSSSVAKMRYNARALPQRKKIIAGSVGASWVMFFIPHHTNQNEKLNPSNTCRCIISLKGAKENMPWCKPKTSVRCTPGAHLHLNSFGRSSQATDDWSAMAGRVRPPWKKPNSSWKRWHAKCHGQPLDLTMKSMTLSLPWTHLHSKPWQTWHGIEPNVSTFLLPALTPLWISIIVILLLFHARRFGRHSGLCLPLFVFLRLGLFWCQAM